MHDHQAGRYVVVQRCPVAPRLMKPAPPRSDWMSTKEKEGHHINLEDH